MTDLEISKSLALAIGYLPEHARPYGVGSINFNRGEGVIHVFRHDGVYGVERTDCRHLWWEFKYTDWNVIGPIAARYDCFPTERAPGYWVTHVFGEPYVDADTPQKAIALAVIGAKK